MHFSPTGIIFLFVSIALAFIAFRIFVLSGREKKRNRITRFFFYSFVAFAVIIFLFFTASLFGDIKGAIKAISVINGILLGIGCGFLAYLIAVIKFPKINPWAGFIAACIAGLIIAILDYMYAMPSITESHRVDWGLPNASYILITLLFIFTFLPISIILLQQYRSFQDSFLKAKALGFALVLLGGFAFGITEFFIDPFFGSSATYATEIVSAILAIIIIGYYFFLRPKRDSTATNNPKN